MEKTFCPACGDILALSVTTDMDTARRSGEVLIFNDDPVAALHCTQECGYRRRGLMAELTLEISTGLMLTGRFIPEP